MGGSWSNPTTDRQHPGCQVLDPRKMEGMWWLLAKCPSECDTPCDRETMYFKYDCSKLQFDITSKCWNCDSVVSTRSITHTFACYQDLAMPAKVLSKANDNDASNGMNGCHTIHFVDDCYAVIEGPVGCDGCAKVWVLSRREKVKADEIDSVLAMVRSHGLNASCLVASCDAVVSEECHNSCTPECPKECPKKC